MQEAASGVVMYANHQEGIVWNQYRMKEQPGVFAALDFATAWHTLALHQGE